MSRVIKWLKHNNRMNRLRYKHTRQPYYEYVPGGTGTIPLFPSIPLQNNERRVVQSEKKVLRVV